MDLGTRIKKLRLQKTMTQEQLADYLSVSVQTISRWETSVNYPDVTMIPILANIFDVTTDYLLGVDIVKNKEVIDKIKKEAHEFKHIGHLDKAIELLRKEIKQFPNNYELLLELSSTLNYQGDRNIEGLKESVEKSKKVLETSVNEKYRREAITNLFYGYLNQSKKKEARKIYDKYIVDNLSPDDYAGFVLEGDELINYLQQDILNKIHDFWCNFLAMKRLSSYTQEEKIKILDKLNQISSIIIENEDYGFHSWYLYTVNKEICKYYTELKDKENTLKYLEKAKVFAVLFDTRPEIINRTSILVNKTKDIREETTTNSKVNSTYEMLESTKHKEYNFIRNELKFIEIIDELKKYAKENI